MKRTLLLAALLLVVAAPAMAAGVNINWGSVCYPEAPVSVKTFACNSNAVSAFNGEMTVSWKIDTDMSDLVGIEVTAMGQTALPALPDWWKLNTGECRANQMNYTSDKTLVEDAQCVDWTAGTAFNLFGWIYQADPSRVQINGGCAIDATTPVTALAGQEYYGGEYLLKNSKTVGTGSCAGCSDEFIVGMWLVTVAGLDGRRDDLFEALPGGNHCLWWNPPGGTPTLQCEGNVPARPITWGQVKSLYR